jgi:DNA-binding NtrC family response regulator
MTLDPTVDPNRDRSIMGDAEHGESFTGLILVVEDDTVVLDSLRMVLLVREPGIPAAASAKDATRDAIGIVALCRPTVVATDIFTGDADGLELFRLMRAGHPEVPVVEVSGATLEDDLRLLLASARLGATEMLEKPLDTDQLLAIVRRTMTASARRVA